ncbi:Na(+)/H(+) exchange regulatory cofactor NHE-RF2 isoform X4 [Electrophorus electricus]|uniref:Na(+)/H(+) exchange regulatory cofactor NHE-RF2 isoform X4 n=1 Tax=Electrophorus electricus TaxID=8005 RepID=UPI0015CFDCFC|nr:Na(+)/H(+) exchange regulatory cofactor NHE-RF2 isoform X4 [Electrophorus electricus]
MASDLKPRLCCMTKAENGYGFHLHGEKGKSGQYIRKVEPGSPAEASGLRAGDRVVEVNGENVERETHHQVVQRIKAVEDETRLLVVDRQTDECLRSLRLTCTEDMATNVSPSPAPPPGKRENGSVSSPPAALTGEVPKPRRRSPSHAGKKDVQVPGKSSSADSSHLVPRLCHLVRADTGYGFNLHSEKSRPGQYIRSLDPDSPANRAGLRPQDRLIEVNGVNIECMRHAEVVAFIKRSGDETHLLVVDPDTDEHFKRLGIIPSSNQAKDCQAQSITNGTQSPHFNGRTTSQSTHSDHSSQDTSTQNSEDGSNRLLDPFAEIGLKLSPTAAEAKEKAHAKRARKRAPHMDWNKKYELFSNF